MKITYLLNQRFPTEKAYGIQVAKMCEAFASMGHNVELFVPYRRNHIKEDIFDFYDLNKNFKVRKFWAPDFYFPGSLDRIAFWIKNLISGFIISKKSLKSEADIFYSRDELPLFFLSLRPNKKLFFEIHRVSSGRKFFYKRFKKRDIKFIAISEGVKDDLKKIGINENMVLVAHDGVDLEKFDLDISKEAARIKLKLPNNKPIILSNSSLYDWKGVDVLIESAQFLSETNIVNVGGTKEEIERFKKCHNIGENVFLIERQPYKLMPFYLKSADILVISNKKGTKVSEKYTSPLKAFEFMASNRPIVASDIESLRNIFQGKGALYFEPDNPRSLADKLKILLKDEGIRNEIIRELQNMAVKYTWDTRVEKILYFINGKTP